MCYFRRVQQTGCPSCNSVPTKLEVGDHGFRGPYEQTHIHTYMHEQGPSVNVRAQINVLLLKDEPSMDADDEAAASSQSRTQTKVH